MTKDIKEPEAHVEDNRPGRMDSGTPGEVREYGKEYSNETDEQKIPISELRKVRAEAAKYRKRLRQLESSVEEERKQSETTKMEEVEKLRSIAREAESKAREFKQRSDVIAKRSAIINSASSLGFYNPRDAASMVDLSQIEIDDSGNVDTEIVNEMVNNLAESKPYLIKGQKPNQEIATFGPTNPPSADWPKPKLRAQDRINQLKHKSNELVRSGKMESGISLYNKAWEEERGIKKPTGG